MFPVNWFHQLYELRPPAEVVCYLVLAGLVLSLLCGLVRNRKGLWTSLPACLYLLTSYTMVYFVVFPDQYPLTKQIWWGIYTVALGTLLIHQLIRFPQPDSQPHNRFPENQPLGVNPAEFSTEPTSDNNWGIRSEKGDSQRGWGALSKVYLLVVVVLAGLFVFDSLGNYVTSLRVWETPVSRAFCQTFKDGEPIKSYLLERLKWDDGLMSSGQKSFLYGAPTYALMSKFGFTPFWLRFSSAVAGIFSIIFLYLIGKSFFNATVGNLFAALGLVNASLMHYARYGTSAAATQATCLCAVWCGWKFLEDDNKAWFWGPVAGVAISVASLHYAPGRLVLLILCFVLVVFSFVKWRRFFPVRVVGLVGLGFVIFLFVAHQSESNTLQNFHRARGEQFFNFLQSPMYLREYLGRSVAPEQLTRFDKFELLYRVLENSIPQYLGFILAGFEPQDYPQITLNLDPPRIPLYFSAFVPFLVWGLATSLRRFYDYRHATMLLWVVLSTPPLLLTNRVDSHRILMFAIPGIFWTGIGLWEGCKTLQRCRVPLVLQHLLAVLLFLPALAVLTHELRYTTVPSCDFCEDFQSAVESSTAKKIILGSHEIDHRQISWANLWLTERQRQDSERQSALLEDNIVQGILDRRSEINTVAFRHVLRRLTTSDLILAPSNQFKRVTSRLQTEGGYVQQFGEEPFDLYLITVQPDLDESRTEPIQIPTPVQYSLPVEPHLKLDEMEPIEVETGFADPVMGSDWQGQPIEMGDTVYTHGIGIHAWTRLKYRVPSNAVELYGVVGLSDRVKHCEKASVNFLVRNASDEILFDSEPFTIESIPLEFRIPVQAESVITLEVDDAGDGRDCDHANWGHVRFLLE